MKRLETESADVQKTELNENESLAAELSKSLIKEKAVLDNKNSAIKDEKKSVAEFEEILAKAKVLHILHLIANKSRNFYLTKRSDF